MVIKDQQHYRNWALAEENLPLFFRPWWLDLVCGQTQWTAILVKNNKTKTIEGVLPYFIRKKWGILSMIDNPMLTPFTGPWLLYPDDIPQLARYSFEMRVLDELAQALPKVFFYRQKCHYQLQNWLPFYHLGFRQTTRYSYVLDDTSDLEEVWKGIDKQHRHNIKVAQRSMQLQRSNDVVLLYELVTEVFANRNKKIPFSLDFAQTVYQKGQTQIFVAQKTTTGESEAAIMTIKDANSVYLLMTGRKKEGTRGAVAALIWQAIQFYSPQGITFDFEGSMMPGVEPFFRRFGGVQRPYFYLKKGWRILG